MDWGKYAKLIVVDHFTILIFDPILLVISVPLDIAIPCLAVDVKSSVLVKVQGSNVMNIFLG